MYRGAPLLRARAVAGGGFVMITVCAACETRLSAAGASVSG
jgi:hypothetical protein